MGKTSGPQTIEIAIRAGIVAKAALEFTASTALMDFSSKLFMGHLVKSVTELEKAVSEFQE